GDHDAQLVEDVNVAGQHLTVALPNITELDEVFLKHGFYSDDTHAPDFVFTGGKFIVQPVTYIYHATDPVGYANDSTRRNRHQTPASPGAQIGIHLQDANGAPVQAAE